jgi:hypothetical protein
LRYGRSDPWTNTAVVVVVGGVPDDVVVVVVVVVGVGIDVGVCALVVVNAFLYTGLPHHMKMHSCILGYPSM